MDDNLVCEPAVEEVVETEAITLATADDQIVQVISKEQYERLMAAAGRQKTYRCDTCNRTFTNNGHFQQHFSLRYTGELSILCVMCSKISDGRLAVVSTEN